MKKIAIVFVAVFYCLLPNVTKAQRTCTDEELSFTITHPNVLCLDATAIATVNIEVGGGGNTDVFWYEWSDGSITQSIQITEAGTYSVTVTDIYNACSKSDSFEIIQSQFTVPDISVHQCGATGNQVYVCGNTVELCAETVSAGDNPDFVWLSNGIEGSFDDQTSSNTTFTLSPDVQISRYRDVDFLFTATNGDCSSTDTMHVRFIQKPEANAGVDAAVCGRSYNLHGEWSFPPSDDYTPTGQWIVGESPNGATVNWATAPATETQEDITVTHYGVYTFIFREMNNWGDAASCYDRDTVTVEFMEQPSVYAGENFPVCGTDFELNAISSHVEGDSIRGQWICLSASGDIFDDPYNPHTTGHYSASESAVSATFRWIETNHPHIEVDAQETCAGQSDITVTFYPQPSARINMGPGDTAVCGLEYEFLRAELPGDGITGMWYEESSLTMFGPQNAAITSPTAPASVTSYGRHEYYWILYALIEGQDPSFCTDTAGPWHIDFIQQPTAQIAETEHTFCGYYGELSELHISSSEGTGTWSSSVSQNIVSFNEANAPGTIVNTTILNSGNSQYPYYELYWTVQNTEYCTDKDTIKVTFARIPSDSIVVIPPKCFGEAAILTAYEDSLAIYDWEFGNGFIDSIAYNSAMGEYRVIMEWYDMQTNHVVGLTTTNSWGCQSSIGRAIVEEPDLPEYDYNIISDTCALGKGGIEFLDTTGLYAFFWIDTTAGPTVTNPSIGYAITDSHVYNLPTGFYTYRSDYQSFNRDYYSDYYTEFGNVTCHYFPEVEVGTIGMIEADFVLSADALEAPANATFLNYTNFDNVDDHICEWHFGDGATESNCEEFVEHIYTAPGCYEPYLVVSIGTIPECRDTAWLYNCVFVDRCTVWEDKDTAVNNYIQLGGHTFYTDGVYQFEIETDDTCRHILRLHYTIMNGVDEYDSDDICISPNPTSDILHISSPVPISRVEIFSIDGRNIGIFETNESDVEYDVSKFVEGVYFARIYGTDGRMCSVKKFIKE